MKARMDTGLVLVAALVLFGFGPNLAAAGEVIGIRVRGVTFVGQTESGTLQIIANEDAPLGQQPFLRLEGVGTIEDEPVYLGSCFLRLEIVE